MIENMSKENRMARWGRIRGKGRMHFIINYGIFYWGTMSGVLFFLLDRLLQHGIDASAYFSEGWLSSFWSSMVSFWLGGILFGYLLWKYNEKVYRGMYENNV